MSIVNSLFALGSSVSNNSNPTSNSMDGVQSNAEGSFNPWVDGDRAHVNDLSAAMGEVNQGMRGNNLQAAGNEATRDEDMRDATATNGSKGSESGVEGGKVG